MHAALADHLYRALEERRAAANLRQLLPRPESEAERLVDFASNDYLGLSREPRVVAAFADGARRYGVGATASAAICGYTDAHAELEDAVARFCRRPRARLFSSGYLANLAVAGTLVRRNAAVFQDRLNHASLIDAATLARAKLHRYPHADVAAVGSLIGERQDALIVTDGVFSMDGDIAPLAGLARLAAERQCTLVVDDAHGLGVVGTNGRGSGDRCGLGVEQLPVLVGTFGKAFGGAGAFVTGEDLLIESLTQFARTHLYTTAMPPAMACAMLQSLHIVDSEPERIAQLHANIAHFRVCASAAGLRLIDSTTPIQPLVIGDNDGVQRVGAALRERGFRVGAIRPPTVPSGAARLRITLAATHRRADIEALVGRLGQVLGGA